MGFVRVMKLGKLKTKTINEAIEDIANVDEKIYGTMGHVMANAINTSKKRKEEVQKVMEERKSVMPNEDRYAHMKDKGNEQMKKMHLSEDAFEMIDLRNRGNKSRKSLKESMGGVGDISKFLEKSVNGLINGDATNYRYKLDDRLAIFVGWSEGYGDEKRDDVIQDENDLDWGINAGIKVWTSDDMWTDFDFVNFPYYDNGIVVDTAASITEDEDYEHLARYFVAEYNKMKDLTIDEDGRIIEDSTYEEDELDESFLNETDDVDSKKCADILNNWIDWEEANYDSDNALDQLRSLQTEKAITEKEYDFIVKNWDDLLQENFGEEDKVEETQVSDKEELTEDVKFGQSSLDELVGVIKEYYSDYAIGDAIDSIFNFMSENNEDETYKLVYALAEKLNEYVGEEVQDCQKYGSYESPFEKKDSQFVKAEQKDDGLTGLTESKKSLNEDVKVIIDLASFKPWTETAIETWDKIKDNNKIDTLDFMLEDMYPEGIGETELNDLLRFDSEWVLDMVGLSEKDDVEDEEDDINEFEESVKVENDDTTTKETSKGSEYDIDVTDEEAQEIAENLLKMMGDNNN